jgi:hypothetical protein
MSRLTAFPALPRLSAFARLLCLVAAASFADGAHSAANAWFVEATPGGAAVSAASVTANVEREVHNMMLPRRLPALQRAAR